MRYAVIGTAGSGKTTMAKCLAQYLHIPHIELDALYWQPGWTPCAKEVFLQRVSDALMGEAWVVDGNYSSARDITWRRACALVWLDYPLALSLVRLAKRTIARSLSRQVLWNNNRETLRNAVLSRDSLFIWAVSTHERHRREFLAALGLPEYAHLNVSRLHTPKAARIWLANIAKTAKMEAGTQ